MSGFPANVIDELLSTFTTYFPGHSVVDKPLRYLDSSKSVGIFIVDLTPDQQNSSFIGQIEPAINRYTYRIQNMIKATNESEGRALFSLDAKTIKAILYRDDDLLLRLSQLTEDLLGTRERFKRIGLSRQSFLNNELAKGNFIYLAMTDIWIETDVSKL